MKISYNWLREYVKLPDSLLPDQIAEKLKLSTVEVEEVTKLFDNLEGVVVGKVLKAEKHPEADKLKVCEVDLGSEKVTIVCGGSNVKDGMLCAVAKIGARVKWHGEGDLVTLEKAKIRNVESFGMICGADEIGLLEIFPKSEEKEIVDLTELKLKVGKPLAEALKLSDFVFEIDNKSLSNRPDLWGHYGIAREIAALNNRLVQEFKVKDIKPGSKAMVVKIENPKSCPRYMAVAVEGVKIGESSALIKQRLVAAGIRPINNVVDITNYVMMALGQPMHAFDGRLLETSKGFQVGVRAAKAGEKFTTLDEKVRDLSEGDLLITSATHPVGIAGIMGGLESEIKSDTTTVVFEAANFSGTQIRKTSTGINLRTDASSRFEKKLDPEMCEVALKKAVEMLIEVCPGAAVVSKIADEGETKKRIRPLEMKTDFISKYSGVQISEKNIKAILERLGFSVETKGDIMQVTVPSWRTEDVVSPEAVVEEVIRIHGFESIEGTLPKFTITPTIINPLRKISNSIGDVLSKDFAFTEIYNYSFVSASQINKLGDNLEDYLELDNPLSKERPYLRRSLLPNLLENLVNNAGRTEIKIFEIGRIYQKELPGLRTSSKSADLLPRQDVVFTALVYSRKSSGLFSEMKTIADRIFVDAGIRASLTSESNVKSVKHPARSAVFKISETEVGECYELHPKVVKNFGLEGRIGVLSLNLFEICNLEIVKKYSYEPIAVYPGSVRDLAFVVSKQVTHSDIVNALKDSDKLLKSIEMFDTFEGEGTGEGKKSVAYHLTFVHPDRTMTSEEVIAAEKKIREILKNTCAAEFRD